MQKFNGFEAKRSTRELLPAGGYIAKVMAAEEQKFDWGSFLVISFDIADGRYKDFFASDYRNQDGENKKWRGTFRLRVPHEGDQYFDSQRRSFNSAMWAFETSNPGYHWDWNENGLKGKSVGVLFRDREWEMTGNDGVYRTGWTTECCSVTDVESIRNESFKMPKAKALQKTAQASAAAWAPISADDASDLPF